MDSGNAFLPGFLERFKQRSASPAVRPENLHRALNVKTDRLTDILCHREQRCVSEQLTMSYDRKQIILARSELSEGLGGKYVDLYEFPDGTLEVRSKGHSLPYRLFSKDQRMSHTAVVENKRLSHALTIIKAQQDIKNETKIKTNSEKIGYNKSYYAALGRALCQHRRLTQCFGLV
jgi:AraC-like DNA-binding protein